jgi:hypothetical protein
MASSENYIYLVILAIGLLSSLLSKKKKKEAEPETKLPPVVRMPWEDGDREYSQPAPTPVKKVPAPPQNREIKRETKPFLNEEKKIYGESIEKKSQTIVVHNEQFQMQETEDEPIILPDFSSLDEVKRGIIFNEIFNKKFN